MAIPDEKPVAGFTSEPVSESDLLKTITIVGNSPSNVPPGFERINVDVWRHYLGSRNPAAVRQDVQPVAHASIDNDFVPALLKDQQFYDLCDEMVDRDEIIGGTESIVASQVVGRRIFVQCENETEAESEAKQFIEDEVLCLSGTFGFRNFLRSMVEGARRHGFAVAEIMWQVEEDGSIVPEQLIHRHPGQFFFDARGECYLYSDSSDPTVPRGAPLPERKFVVFTMPGMYGNPFGQSVVFPLRFTYFFKKNARKALIDAVETNGTPILRAKFTDNLQDREYWQARCEEMLENIRRQSGLVLPDGIDIEAISRGLQEGSLPHMELIDYLDRMMVRRLTGSTLSTMENAGTGSLSQSLVHAKVADEMLIPMLDSLQNCLQEQLIEVVHELNFGEDVECPYIMFDLDGETSIDDAVKKFAAGRENGIELSKAQMREELRLTEPYDAEDVAKAPASTPAVDPYSQAISGIPTPEPSQDTSVETIDNEAIAKSEDAAAEMSDRKRIEYFSDSKNRRRYEARYVKMLDTFAEELYSTLKGEYVGAVKSAVGDVLNNFPKESQLSLGAAGLARIELPDVSRKVMPIVAAIRAVGLHNIAARANATGNKLPKKLAPGVFIFADSGEFDDIPDQFAEGLKWMLDRGISTPEEVRAMAEEIRRVYGGRSTAQIENELRRQYLAIAGSPNPVMTRKFGELIASGVRNGETVGGFLQTIDAYTNAGALPPAMDSYLHNVYRTETAHVYEAQRQANLAEMGGLVWGKEWFNPEDSRSRDSHAAIDGVIVKLGSEADMAIGEAPFSFNCRCSWTPIFQGEATEETPGAAEIGRNLERFSDGSCGCGHDHGDELVQFSDGEAPEGFGDYCQLMCGDVPAKAKAVHLVPRGNGSYSVSARFPNRVEIAKFSLCDDGLRFSNNLAGARYVGNILRVPITGAQSVSVSCESDGGLLWRFGK